MLQYNANSEHLNHMDSGMALDASVDTRVGHLKYKNRGYADMDPNSDTVMGHII